MPISMDAAATGLVQQPADDGGMFDISNPQPAAPPPAQKSASGFAGAVLAAGTLHAVVAKKRAGVAGRTTAILPHLPLPAAGVSIWMERRLPAKWHPSLC